jgi:hypothetical protein
MSFIRTFVALAAGFALAGAAIAQARPTPKTAAKSAPSSAPLPEANGEQLLAASMVLLGRHDCEYQQVLVISQTPGANGYVDGEILRRKATFKPVRSSTGAIRLEEVRSGELLLLQIPTKTILMDVKAGRRLVDNCQHDEQKKEAAVAASGDGNRLGINAPGQISVTGTPASKN